MIAQLDFLTFFPQMFWLYIFFLLFYFVFTSYFLPNIYNLIRARNIYFNILIKFSLFKNFFYNYLNISYSISYSIKSVGVLFKFYSFLNIFLLNLKKLFYINIFRMSWVVFINSSYKHKR